jgi:tRNA pseudouridine55 synthase
VVTPLAEAAAAAFPRVDLTADEARRLAQGARLPLPPHVPPTAAKGPGTPFAAFAPDGALVALVTEEGGRLRSLAVFVDAAGVSPR